MSWLLQLFHSRGSLGAVQLSEDVLSNIVFFRGPVHTKLRSLKTLQLLFRAQHSLNRLNILLLLEARKNIEIILGFDEGPKGEMGVSDCPECRSGPQEVLLHTRAP